MRLGNGQTPTVVSGRIASRVIIAVHSQLIQDQKPIHRQQSIQKVDTAIKDIGLQKAKSANNQAQQQYEINNSRSPDIYLKKWNNVHTSNVPPQGGHVLQHRITYSTTITMTDGAETVTTNWFISAATVRVPVNALSVNESSNSV
jgi:hypothetical protein